MGLKHNRILDLIYRSFDTTLTKKEQHELDLALKNSKQLQREMRQIEIQREAVRESGRDYSFTPAFAGNVMSRLVNPKKSTLKAEPFYESLLTIFKRLSIAAAAACILLIAYNLSKGESFQAEEALFISQDAYEEIMDLSLF